MTEIASAYVTLTTRMPGVKKDIEKTLDGVDTEDVGAKMGDGLGKGITTKQAAIAGAVGGIFASMANMAASALGDLIADAVAMSDATDKFAQTLNFAGLDTSAIDAAMEKSRAYADSTVYDLSTIQNTTAQLAANGITNYSELTEAAGNLNAVAGGNADTFSSVAMMLTQTAGQGKLTTENWNQLADAIPGASGRLQEALANAGAYTGNFRDAMEKGEITADEFNAALLELGTEPVAVAAASSVATMEGAVGNLSAAVTGVLADAFTAIKPFLTDFVAGIAWFISESGLFVPVITGLATALLVVFAPAIWAAVTAVGAFTLALLANPITWVIIGITALVAAIVWMVQNWDQVVAFITEIWGGFINWITGVLEGFVGWWNDMWTGFGNWVKSVWDGFVAWITSLFVNFVAWMIAQGARIISWWNGLWSGIGNFVKGIWDGIVSGVKNYMNMLRSGIQIVGNAISSWWNGLWRGIGNFFSSIWNGIVKAVENIGKTFRNVFEGVKGFIANAFKGAIGIIKAPINGIIGLVNNAIRALNGLSVSIPDWVPIVGGQTWGVNLPTIPQLASGGVITGSSTGTLALIGEAGRGRDEAVLPLPADWRENGIGGDVNLYATLLPERGLPLQTQLMNAARSLRTGSGIRSSVLAEVRA